jgi:hypothetical protein
VSVVIIQDYVDTILALEQREAREVNGYGNLRICTQFRAETAANLLQFRFEWEKRQGEESS